VARKLQRLFQEDSFIEWMLASLPFAFAKYGTKYAESIHIIQGGDAFW